jgi:hypothetical protein
MTAVEFLVDKLFLHEYEDVIKQALEMEREQKIEFAINVFHNRHDNESIFVTAERTLNNQ